MSTNEQRAFCTSTFQTESRVNDVCECFLMQSNIDDFRGCTPNHLRKVIVEYSSMQADNAEGKRSWPIIGKYIG